ncbi:hypothetical protein F5Y03DRAFT_367129 [Xylaria venustula]|nr:hypothetical protein F5Y03DRAFT_367129 [Xylaria venustula]
MHVLMHHISDLENATRSIKDSPELEHVQVLLEFLRPRYEQHYVPAKERLLSYPPTVRFDDLWVIMKPGSLAYTLWDGHRIGCVLGKMMRLHPKPSQDIPERWSIDFWFLQVHWPSDQIGCTRQTATINRFDGERPVISLPIYPADSLKIEDRDETKQRFINRGRKVCDILSGQSMYMEYDGKCMDHTKMQYTGRIIVGRSHDIEDQYLKHNWNFDWVPLSEINKDSDDTLSDIEAMINPKTDTLTPNHLFVLSPCLSAFRLPKNDWVPLNVENILPLTSSPLKPPYIDSQKLNVIEALVDSQKHSSVPSPSLSQHQRNAVTILLRGPPGVGKSYTIEYLSSRSHRPLVKLGPKDLSSVPELLIATLTRWFSLRKKWNAILFIAHCDILHGDHLLGTAFAHSLEIAEGTLFLTTNKSSNIRQRFRTFISIKVTLPELNYARRDLIWSDMETRRIEEGTIGMDRRASKFLRSDNVLRVPLNGHEMNHCFKIAIALAKSKARDEEADAVLVEVDHLKEAMNIVYESRQHTGSALGFEGQNRFRKRTELTYNSDLLAKAETPKGKDIESVYQRPLGTALSEASSEDLEPSDDEFDIVRRSMTRKPEEHPQPPSEVSSLIVEHGKPPLELPLPQPSLTVNDDSGLCIPTINWADWDTFRAQGGKQLFRRTCQE